MHSGCTIVHYMDSSPPLARLIGERVRKERQGRQWTLDQLADMSEVSRRILLKVSDALGVGLSALVDSPTPTAVKVTRNGTGPVLWTGDAGGRAVLLASTAPPDVVELWDWTLCPAER